MTSKENLISELNKLAIMFPFSKYSYEYDQFSLIHIIQVWPVEQYNLDNNYKAIETKISIDFDDSFFPESVLFVSEDSLNQVVNPEVEIEGLFYGRKTTVTVVNHGFECIIKEFSEEGFSNYALAA